MSQPTIIGDRDDAAAEGRRGHWPFHLGGAALAVVIAGAAYTVFLAPLIARAEDIRRAEAQVADLERTVEASRRLRASAVRRTAEARAELADVQLELRPVNELNRRLDDVVTLATECSLDLAETDFDPPLSGRWYDTVPISIEGRGQFSDCTRFLHLVQRRLPDVDVVGFDLTRNPGDSVDEARFRVDLAWYTIAGSGRLAVDG